MGEVCFQSFFVCDFFSLFCQTKEDSEEEEVEEVVYKDSSHFLKVFIFYMYVLPIYKMYNFQFNNFHHLRKKGVKSQDITIIFKPYYHYTNTQDKSYHFKPKATSSFRTLFIYYVYFVFPQGTQSANPHNDYCQHFVDTGQRPHNFIRDVG